LRYLCAERYAAELGGEVLPASIGEIPDVQEREDIYEAQDAPRLVRADAGDGQEALEDTEARDCGRTVLDQAGHIVGALYASEGAYLAFDVCALGADGICLAERVTALQRAGALNT
jgi:hypothetical protein